MIRRTFDPRFLNEVANDPAVFPWLGADGPVDLSEAIGNPVNFALIGEGGGFVLMGHGEGIYEVHSLFLPSARRDTVKAMRAGFEYMFTRTDCLKVITQVPDNNPAAAALARLARFRPMFRREETPRGPTAYMGLTIEEWAQDSRDLERDGEWFHASLEEAKRAQGSSLPVHAHDQSHERTVGAAVRMVRAGNVQKAVDFYNRWARFAGYLQIVAVSQNPPTVDVVDAVVEWRNQEMEILLCR